VKLNINSVEVHPQLSNNRHLVDGVLVGAGLLVAVVKGQGGLVILLSTQVPSFDGKTQVDQLW
jgi:hypothetical protein